jgi:TetR/AcrR family acrAB operon transcriptional repressor
MLISPDLFDMAEGAQATVDAMLDAIRYSPALRVASAVSADRPAA